MKTITTIAAIAALTTLTACGDAEAPAETTVEVPATDEAAETEAANDDVAAEEVAIDKQKNPNEQIP
jgi:ABC-type glycerol-3-phosphate transport system substrate-binding protein